MNEKIFLITDEFSDAYKFKKFQIFKHSMQVINIPEIEITLLNKLVFINV